MTNKQRAHHVQFSKKIVVAVTICVTVLCITSIVLCFMGADLAALTDVVKVYIQYAMIVFAAYSGNSAIQKWLTYRGPRLELVTNTDNENEQESEG